MAKAKIVWSDLAYLSYTDIVNYLTDHYSLEVAVRFDEEVEILLDKLRSFRELCPPYEKRAGLRKCTVNTYTSLLYRVDGKTIHLITFFDNRGIHTI
jgi:plasmid stabilization system protein ParE